MKTSEGRSALRRKSMAAVSVAALLTGLVAFTAPSDTSDEAARLSGSTLTSLRVSPDLLVAGGTATATVRRNTTAGNLIVDLTSGNPAIATVPSRITIGGRTSSESFAVNGVRGEGGCTTISARSGRSQRVSTKIAVAPSVPPATRLTSLKLNFGSQSGLADSGFDGQTLRGTVTLSSPTTRGATIALTSNAPSQLDMPASVNIPPRSSSASFSMKQRSPGNVDCAVVTASLGTATAKRLVLFWASPEGW